MLNVAFIWHMHQPLYKDRFTGQYLMPWVRLHGLKDYLDMVAILRQYPKIRQTFNLVPSLLEQIEDYADHGATDLALELTLKPVKHWTAEDRTYVMLRFFDAHPDYMIAIFPRYHQLALKRNDLLAQFGPEDASRALTHQDLLDLTVLFNLAWFDPLWRQTEPEIASLVQRGSGFTQADREILVSVQRRLLGRIIPEYAQMQARGQIELTTSPYYHPILPLLIDTDCARAARPMLPLPAERFSYPGDARLQVDRALAYFETRFGFRPKGFWPSEQSVSLEVAALLAKEGIAWAVSDEGILAHSLKTRLVRDASGQVLQPDVLYQPYVLETAGGKLTLVFRDIVLSDLIGFSYARVPGAQAARDLHDRLIAIARKSSLTDPLVTIALDGENCWENYAKDGWDFLHAFYDAASRNPAIELCTVGSYLARHPPTKRLETLHAGSWIASDFTTWIGEPTKNRAWELLLDARLAFESYVGPNRDDAHEELLCAEGSDWFWWFGAGHVSGQDELFDLQFRLRLENTYRLIGAPIPMNLGTPIVPAQTVVAASVPASCQFLPGGEQGAMHAGGGSIASVSIRVKSSDLVMEFTLATAMTPGNLDEIIVGLFYPGQTRHNSPLNARPSVELIGITQMFLFAHEIRIGFEPLVVTVSEAGEVFTWHQFNANSDIKEIEDVISVTVPMGALGPRPGQEIHVVIGICRSGQLLEVHPSNRTLVVAVPVAPVRLFPPDDVESSPTRE